jgi:molecular chaperone GrpE
MESPEQLVDALEHQIAELKDRELKAQAELENFRRRILRDVDLQLKFAALPFVRDLLEVVDNLHRATESTASGSGAEGVVAGVRLVQQQLASVLAKHHCAPIESVGKAFDPNVHQAIAQHASQEFPAGTVMMETSMGYMMHDRVIRPSMVIVSTGPS